MWMVCRLSTCQYRCHKLLLMQIQPSQLFDCELFDLDLNEIRVPSKSPLRIYGMQRRPIKITPDKCFEFSWSIIGQSLAYLFAFYEPLLRSFEHQLPSLQLLNAAIRQWKVPKFPSWFAFGTVHYDLDTHRLYWFRRSLGNANLLQSSHWSHLIALNHLNHWLQVFDCKWVSMH